MRGFGWTVLGLVFLDELLAVAAIAVWGVHAGGWWLAVLLAVLTVVVWSLFASPKARYGGPALRPAVKTIVFVLASAGLWAAGHPALAVAMLVFSAVVNGLAQLPGVRVLVDQG